MKKINILSPGFTSPNSAAFLFPLIKFKRALNDNGFDVNIINKINAQTTQCDTLMIDSKTFKHSWGADKFDNTLEKIAGLNEKTKLIWCDQADSTGTFLGQVLPHVDKYLKSQILKDRTEYTKEHYASRIYADYYHKKHGITDQQPYIKQPAKNPDDLNKIGISWNSALMNYGRFGPHIPRIRSRLPINSILQFSAPFAKANNALRPHDITCRMGISYPRETICFQRKKIREQLGRKAPTGKLSRKGYLQEMSESKICVSPFGLGEITLKDFEGLLAGSLLLKPNMNHMETWPNLFIENETCLFHDWDLETLQEKIDWALHHKQERTEIAKAGQENYLNHTIHKDAPETFAQHFKRIID